MFETPDEAHAHMLGMTLDEYYREQDVEAERVADVAPRFLSERDIPVSEVP